MQQHYFQCTSSLSVWSNPCLYMLLYLGEYCIVFEQAILTTLYMWHSNTHLKVYLYWKDVLGNVQKFAFQLGLLWICSYNAKVYNDDTRSSKVWTASCCWTKWLQGLLSFVSHGPFCLVNILLWLSHGVHFLSSWKKQMMIIDNWSLIMWLTWWGMYVYREKHEIETAKRAVY